MADDRWEPLAKLSTALYAIEGLRDLFSAEEPLDDASMRVAHAALGAIEHADIVSITVLTWPEARTTAFTDDRALDLDAAQYTQGRGPCLEAAWESIPIRVVIGEEQHRWPEFIDAATHAGIRASLSVPLLVDGLDQVQESVGSLNIYRCAAEAFDPFDAVLMSVYTLAAGFAITNARRWQQSRETVTQLETALTSRGDRHGQGRVDRSEPCGTVALRIARQPRSGVVDRVVRRAVTSRRRHVVSFRRAKHSYYCVHTRIGHGAVLATPVETLDQLGELTKRTLHWSAGVAFA